MLKENDKSKKQLIKELTELRERSIRLEEFEGECSNMVEDINRSYQTQTVLNKLLYISLKNMTLERMLEKFIDQVTSLSWLALESKGAIFLIGDDTGVLEMKAHRALSDSLLEMCARVPFGKCLCGRAAMANEIVFADGLDDRHDFQYKGISPHGHYCVPISSGRDSVLGVITLYLKEGHHRDPREEEFLNAVANTLVGIIELKKTEQALREREKELELKNLNLEEVNTALKVLLRKKDEDKKEHEEKVLCNIKVLVEPYLEKLKCDDLKKKQQSYVNIIESTLAEIVAPFARRLSCHYLNLTAAELRVAMLVRDGKRTKEIAGLMNVSDKTVEVHRRNIRKKLGIINTKANLRNHLLSFQ
jgi:DNA-binding NarL/FixJ family response regulator